MRPPAPGAAAGGWLGRRTPMGALQGLIPWTNGTFPWHTEHLLGWNRDALESLWQTPGEELLPPPLPGPFWALLLFPRTAPASGCCQHGRREQAAAPTVSTAGMLGPGETARLCQPSPVGVRQCPGEGIYSPFPKVFLCASRINQRTHTAGG